MKPVSPTLSPLVSHGVSETNGSENSSQRANDSSVWRVQEAPGNTWPRRRWWLMLALIFLGQLALIFSLSSRSVLRKRPPARAPVRRHHKPRARLPAPATDALPDAGQLRPRRLETDGSIKG
jgi:hypothetical protein